MATLLSEHWRRTGASCQRGAPTSTAMATGAQRPGLFPAPRQGCSCSPTLVSIPKMSTKTALLTPATPELATAFPGNKHKTSWRANWCPWLSVPSRFSSTLTSAPVSSSVCVPPRAALLSWLLLFLIFKYKGKVHTST